MWRETSGLGIRQILLFTEGENNMFMPKQQLLYEAPAVLNGPGQPWVVTAEGDSIVARWKYMDATFFAPAEVNDETRNYSFTVTLNDNGKYKEVDIVQAKAKSVGMSPGGGLSFGTSSSSFKGKTTQKSFTFGVGQNNQTGETGFIGFKFDTTLVKNQIRSYLESRGWKKAGMFG